MKDCKPLIDKIVSGDTRAFQALIKKYQRLVSHIVFRMVSSESDREDLCQGIFIKVYQNLSNVQSESKISTWIARIAYNTTINYLKKEKIPPFEDCSHDGQSIEGYQSNTTPPDEFAEDSDLAQRLHNEIKRLPVQFRTIVTLYHLDEMSYAEIGEIMGLPEGTVKSYLFRARKLLKKRLTSKFQLEELWH